MHDRVLNKTAIATRISKFHTMKTHLKLLTLAAATCCCFTTIHGEDWPRFRGPNGTGISHSKKIPVSWTNEDYHWILNLPGKGHGSPVVVGDHLYILTGVAPTGTRLMICVDTISGRIRWQKRYASPAFHLHRDNSYASGTPAADQAGVVFAQATPEQLSLVAIHQDGTNMWEKKLGPYKALWGAGISPIIEGDMVLLMNAQMDPRVMAKYLPEGTPVSAPGKSFIIALDRTTGKTRWTVERKTVIAGYATPCLRTLPDGKKEVIFVDSAHGISGVGLKTGKVHWQADLLPYRTVFSPVLAGDLILASHGMGLKGDRLVAVRPPSTHNEPQLVYELKRSVPLVPTPIVALPFAFLWSDAGIVSCIRADTGDLVWQERVQGDYYASPVWIDKKLYGVSRRGDVVILSATERFELISRIPLGETCHATPAVAGDRIFFRTESHLFSLGSPSTD